VENQPAETAEFPSAPHGDVSRFVNEFGPKGTRDMDTLTIRRPDDWHVHFRDGDIMAAVVPWTARTFARAIVMPNLPDPVTTPDAAAAYRSRILACVPDGVDFEPLMTAYLTDTIDADALTGGFERGVFAAAKLYPAGATTNSDKGVTDIRNLWPVFEAMQGAGMPLLVHGEDVGADVDVFDREARFIQTTLGDILSDFPLLRIVFEHATTEDAVAVVRANPGRMAATITAHHLLLNRTDIFRGGIRPHHYCLPIAKREKHRLALVEAATSGDDLFFLGTDTAPHPRRDKESACGCAGLFTAPTALGLYAEVFEAEDALDNLEGFASMHGPRFYGLPINEQTVMLRRTPDTDSPALVVPDGAADPDLDGVVVFRGGGETKWRVETPPGAHAYADGETA
jgi:dihydroorotase